MKNQRPINTLSSPVLKVRIWISDEWESMVSVFEGDTAFTVAERCLRPEFKG